MFAITGILCLSHRTLHAAEIDITGNYLEYEETDKFILARGSVTVTWQSKEVKANEIRFWVDRKYLIAEGDVSIREKNSVMYADRASFDYQASTGEFINVSGYSEPWYFYTQKVERVAADKYTADRMLITTCDLPRPHYTIRANRAKITVDKRVTVYNPVFYLRSVPLFYLPVFTSSLGHRRDSIEIRPGYNNEDGLVIKTIYGYPLSKNTYGKLYIDYFSKRGWGTGAEYNYNIGNRMKGTLYGYHIKEDTTGNERWTLRGSHWQKLDLFWTAQVSVEFLSDTSFNKSYLSDSWLEVQQQIHSYASFTRQSPRSNLRIITERYDVYNSTTSQYDLQSVTVPRIEYTRYTSRSGKSPYYTSLSLSLQNQYTASNDYYLVTGAADASVTRDYRIGRNLTLKPKVGVSETWQDRTSATDFTDALITRYYTAVNARYRAARWMDWDLTYNYQLRSEVNSIFGDFAANDYGEEANKFTFVNSMYLRSNVIVRNSTGYNLHVDRDVNISDWRELFSPLVNELTWTPPLGFHVYVREENAIYPYVFKYFQADSRFGMTDMRYFSLGVFYSYAFPDQLDFNTGFGVWLTDKWKIDYSLGTSVMNDFSGLSTNNQEIKIYRDLHCWQTKVTYRRRSSSEEIYFLLELKSAGKNRAALYPRKHELEFYPWR